MKRCTFLSLFAMALLVLAPAAMAQSATCTAVTPATNAFNAALLGNGFSGTSGSPNGFANVNFSLNGNNATVTANSLGLNNISGIALYQGQPGTASAQLVQTFSGPFTNGQFSGTTTLSPALISQIQANPANYFFVITTPDFPNGAVAGSLAPTQQQLITGVLSAPLIGNAGSFILTVGPNNGTGTVTLNYDITSNSLASTQINSLSLMNGAGGSPLITFGTNATAVNGRIIGSTPISTTLAQQLLQNPCGFQLGINSSTFGGGSATGTLLAGNEIFLPVVGSVQGVGGTNFQTDVNIFNNEQFFGNTPQTVGADVFAEFFPAGTTNSTAGVTAQNVSTFRIPVRGTATMRDISTSMFNGALNGIGALRIVSSGNLAANARIYNNQISSGHGTFGQFEPGMFRSQALQQGVLIGLGSVANNASLANGQSFRTNIGFFNPNPTATTITAELRDAAGTILGRQTFTLGAWTQTQLPLFNAGGLFTNVTSDVSTASVYFLSGNPIFAYASIIDNVSGDASFVTPSAGFTGPGNTTGQ
jgi:hypothetical protein